MEQLILKHFKGEALFYTALGVYFEYDSHVESKLRDIICENRINEVVFVSAINNVFYKHAFEQKVKHNYPVDEALAKTKKKISKYLICPKVFPSNFHLLAARHLTKQKRRLLSTQYLGNHLKKKKIILNTYVYQPQVKVFYNLQEIEKRGYLLKNTSYN